MATDKQVLRVQELKVTAENAYAKYHEAIAKIFEEEGEIVHAIEIEPNEDGKTWLRLSLVDNAARLKRQETVVGISVIRECGAKLDYLKNKPKV